MTRLGPFFAVTAALIMSFAAAGTAIPLYDTYRTENGLTNTDLAASTAEYFFVAVLSLLVLGKLSDRIGRKPVSVVAIAIAIVACVVMMTVDSAIHLYIGRGLFGISAGLAFSAVTAYAVDLAPKRPSWAASTVSTAAPTTGMTIGILGAGALVDSAPLPRVLPFAIEATILVVLGIAVALSPETIRRTRGALASLVPRIAVPRAAWPLMPAAVSIFVATWAYGAFIQSFGPSIAVDYLGSSSALVAAAVVASYMGPVLFGGPLTARLSPAAAQRLGMILLPVAGIGLAVGIGIGQIAIFVISAGVGGLALGITNAASFRALLPTAAPDERAALLAAVYAISYIGGAVPSFIAGLLARDIDLFAISIGYATLAVIAMVITMLTARDQSTAR